MTLIAAPSFIANQGNPVSGPLLSTGNVFYLDDSSAVDADALYTYSNVILAGTPQAPFTTGAFALTQCTANHGDVIVVGKGHSESLATLFALNTKAGVTFIHQGWNIAWVTESTAGSYRSDMHGQVVSRVASLLPATTTLNIFTVVGAIKITEIWGLVEVVFPNTACTVKITAVPTGLTATDVCAASASVALAAVGTVYSITGTLADAGLLTVNQTRIGQATAVIAHTGVIRIQTSGSPATGTISWHMAYNPIKPGSYAIAA